MSKYKPRVGDRVRVSFEAEVQQVYSDGDLRFSLVDYYDTDIPHEGDFSIEKVEPPVVTFRPGDVVRSKSGFGSLVVALDREGYTYLSGSLSDGKRFAYYMGYGPGEFTSEKYELVSL